MQLVLLDKNRKRKTAIRDDAWAIHLPENPESLHTMYIVRCGRGLTDRQLWIFEFRVRSPSEGTGTCLNMTYETYEDGIMIMLNDHGSNNCQTHGSIPWVENKHNR